MRTAQQLKTFAIESFKLLEPIIAALDGVLGEVAQQGYRYWETPLSDLRIVVDEQTFRAIGGANYKILTGKRYSIKCPALSYSDLKSIKERLEGYGYEVNGDVSRVEW